MAIGLNMLRVHTTHALILPSWHQDVGVRLALLTLPASPGHLTIAAHGHQQQHLHHASPLKTPARTFPFRVCLQEAEPQGAKAQYHALKPFVIISLAYLLFTTTDGAVRMIVLLHAYNMGFTAWEVRGQAWTTCKMQPM